jgi:hypothetical protein
VPADYASTRQWLTERARIDVFDFSGKQLATSPYRPTPDAIPIDLQFVSHDSSLLVAYGEVDSLAFWDVLGPKTFVTQLVEGRGVGLPPMNFALFDANAPARRPRDFGLHNKKGTTSRTEERRLRLWKTAMFVFAQPRSQNGHLIANEEGALWDVGSEGASRKISDLPIPASFVVVSPDGNRVLIDDRSGSTPMLFERETGRWFDVQGIEPLATNEEWMLSNDPRRLYRRKDALGTHLYSRYGIAPVLDAQDRWDGSYIYENATSDGK